MHDSSSIKKNVRTIVIARAAFRGFTSLAFLLTYRYFTKDQQGILDTALTWTNAVMTLSDLGMSTLLVKHTSQKHDDANIYFGNALVVQTVMSLLIWIGLLVTASIVGFTPQRILLLALVGAAGLIFEWRKVIRAILRAQMRMNEISIVETLNGLFFVIAIASIFLFISDRSVGLISFGVSQLAVNIFSIALLFWYARRRLTPHVDLKKITSMLRESVHFTLYNTFEMIYVQVDLILLSILRSTEVVATYGGAAKIVNLFLFIPTTIYQVLLPALYSAAKHDEHRFRQLSLRTIAGFGSIGISSAMVFVLFSDPLVPWILGDKYHDTIPVMQWLAIFLGLRFFSIPLTNILLAKDYQKVVAYSQIGTVAVNIILDLILIPRFGAVGPAIATAIVETGNIFILSLLAWKLIFRQKNGSV